MKIIYLSSHSIYKTGANSNRLLSILRGLKELDHDVTLLHSVPIEKSLIQIDSSIYGIIKSFFYHKKKCTIMGRISFALISLFCGFRCYSEIRKATYHNKTYVISLDSLFLNKLIIILLRANSNIVLIKEVLEYPIHERVKLGYFQHLYNSINYRLEYILYDGYLPISTNLESFLKRKIKRKNVNFCIIPICVELDRFVIVEKVITPHSPYIAYCGDMSYNKDGVEILISSFENVFAKFPEYCLFLIGPGEGEYFDGLKAKKNNSVAKNNILFLGNISREEMPAVLKNANILALSRPNNKQAEGGLPTKLGEYLATANPVVVTDVSDIRMYLGSEYAAFISEPDSIELFTEKLLFVIENPEIARQVGLNGQKIAFDKFNYLKVVETIADFISSNDFII